MKKTILYLLLVILLSSFVFSASITIGDNLGATSSGTYKYGVKCEILQDMTIDTITMGGTGTYNCNSCGIYDSTNSLVASGTITDKVCTLSSSYSATDGQVLRFVENEDTQSCSGGANDPTPGYPISDAYISCTTGTYSSGGAFTDNSGYVWAVASIEYDTGSPPQPSLVLNTDLTNNTINYHNQTLNFIYSGVASSGTTNIFNISFYQNGQFNQTLLDVNISNSNWYNITLPDLYEGYYTIEFNASNFEANATSGIYSYNIDLLEPNIVTNLTNNSIYFKNADLLNFYFQSTDNNLYAMNFSIFELNNDGSINQTINNTFIDAIATTSETIRYFNNLTNFNLSRYKLELTSWDSHTAKEIKNYKTTKLSKGYEFKNDIKITSDDLKSMKINKKVDRYSFDMEFNKDNPEIVLECDDLRYLPNSQYEGHLICFSSKTWVDFEDVDADNVEVEFISKDKVKVTPKTKGKKSFKFNSIGNLNENSRNYFFNVTEGFYVYAYNIEDNTTIDEFTVNAVGSINLEESTTTGVVALNQTTGVFNLTLSSAGYVNYTALNVTFSQAGSYSAYMNLSNAFRVYIKNQLNNVLINDRQVNLEFIGINSSNYSTTTGSKFITDLAPDDYILRYSALNYSNAFYYFTLLNGTNTQFTIYMLPSTVTDDVTATVINEISKTVSGAYIHVQRYDLNTNTYRTVEILQTNFEGKAILHVTKNTEFYKFLIYYNDILELETEPTYIYEDSVTFQIQTGQDVGSDFFTTEGINWDLTYNIVTKNFNFDYSDASNTITSGSLYIYNTSYGTQTLYNYSVSSSPSATILITAPNISGYNYLAKAYVNLNGNQIYLGELYYSYPIEVAPSDNSKLFWVIVLVILFATIGFWDLSIALILAPLPLVIASTIKFIPLPLYATLPIEVVAVIIVVIINKRSG